MRVLQVKDYNVMKSADYHIDVANYDESKGGFPYLGTYLYLTNRGNERQVGYIAFDKNRSCWAKTKKEAIRLFNKPRYK